MPPNDNQPVPTVKVGPDGTMYSPPVHEEKPVAVEINPNGTMRQVADNTYTLHPKIAEFDVSQTPENKSLKWLLLGIALLIFLLATGAISLLLSSAAKNSASHTNSGRATTSSPAR